MAIVCNIVGSMGYVQAMAYFDNVVILVTSLMEPVISSTMAYVARVGFLPGTQGWIGNVLVIFGTFAVVHPTFSKKQETEQG